MMKSLALIVILGIAAVGCKPDNGDVETALRATKEAPKSVDELPPDMPPEARASAANAMGMAKAQGQINAQEAQARAHAMEMMRKQGGGG